MASTSYDLSFGDYLRVLRRRKVWIVLCTLAGTSSAFLYVQSQRPMYVSTAKVQMIRDEYIDGQFVRIPRLASLEVMNLSEIARSEPVTRMVVDRLKEDGSLARLNLSEAEAKSYAGSIGVSMVGEKSSVVAMRVSSQQPDVSAAIANGVADALVKRGNIEVEERKTRILGYLDTLVETYRLKYLDIRRRLHEREAAKRRIRLDRSVLVRTAAPSDLNAAYWAARDESERIEAETRDLGAYIAGGAGAPAEGIPTLARDTEFSAAEAAFREADSERQRFLQLYTEQHPSVTDAEERAAIALERLEIVRQEAGRRAMAGLRLQKEAAEAREADILSRIDEVNASLQRFEEEETLREGDMDRDLTSVTRLFEDFRRQRDEVALAMEFSRGDRIEKVEDAAPDPRPVSANRRVIETSGLAIGFLVGVAVAFLRESLDTSITTIEDVERYLQKPVLTVVPPIRIESAKVREYLAQHPIPEGDPRTPIERADLLPTVIDPRAPSAEAYRALRTNLTYNFFAKGKKVLLITSATPQEGKTTTSSNLAVALASAGRRTILLGANVRHPNLGKFFAVNRRLGLYDVAAGRLPLAQAIQPSGVDNLWLLDSGGYITRPADILQSDMMAGVIASLRANFDAVLIDTPPVLPVTDAAILAPKCDGVLLIYYVSVAPREALYRAKVQIESVGADVIGIVLNDILSQARLEYGYYYYYHHRYAGAEERVRI